MAQVNLYASARAALGQSQVELSAENLGDLIEALGVKNEKLAKLLPTCTYLLNGIACEDMGREILQSDQIDVLPQFAGG
jgi:molybdopterin converting factor small subunit